MSSGRYSKIHRRMWTDEKFRRLSGPQPCGQSLWLRLLCGPELGPIPGVLVAREPGLADAMGWDLEPFRQSFQELSYNGLAKADWQAGLVFVYNAIYYNEPPNPNVVQSWADTWAELPECALKSEVHARLCAYMKTRGESFAKIFRNHCPNHSANHCRNQDQDQDQDQDQEGEAPPNVEAKPAEQLRPRTAHHLKLLLRIAIEREQPQNGPWNPGGSFADKEAREFLEGFPDLESALGTIEQRIALFAKDPTMTPWTVAKFAKAYNGIGSPPAQPSWAQPARKQARY